MSELSETRLMAKASMESWYGKVPVSRTGQKLRGDFNVFLHASRTEHFARGDRTSRNNDYKKWKWPSICHSWETRRRSPLRLTTSSVMRVEMRPALKTIFSTRAVLNARDEGLYLGSTAMVYQLGGVSLWDVSERVWFGNNLQYHLFWFTNPYISIGVFITISQAKGWTQI